MTDFMWAGVILLVVFTLGLAIGRIWGFRVTQYLYFGLPVINQQTGCPILPATKPAEDIYEVDENGEYHSTRG